MENKKWEMYIQYLFQILWHDRQIDKLTQVEVLHWQGQTLGEGSSAVGRRGVVPHLGCPHSFH